MRTSALRSMTFVVSLATLFVTAASAGAHPSYKHKAYAHEFVHGSIPVTATALAPAPGAAGVREKDGLSRNDDDCNFGCIDH